MRGASEWQPTTDLTSTLLSSVQTNFDEFEFEIPADYQDAHGQIQPPFAVNPASFMRPPMGANNLEGLRKDYENGHAPLAPR
jgi:hypothetical protein